jgi:hypothetical protein
MASPQLAPFQQWLPRLRRFALTAAALRGSGPEGPCQQQVVRELGTALLVTALSFTLRLRDLGRATLAFFADPLHHIRVALGRSAKDLLTFGMGFGVVTLGAWELYQNKMATRELLWQYRNQLGHFARARRQLARTAGVDSRTAVLTDLGKDCLMESYLWTIHRYHREHEPPGG